MRFMVLPALIIVFALVSCTTAHQAILPETPTNLSTPTLLPMMLPSVAQSTITPSVTPEPTQWARWMDYENALAAVYLPAPALPAKGLCEWQILGQSKQQYYVWAICQVANPEGAAMSAPAVIQFGADNAIQRVEVPGDGSRYPIDVRRLFPPDLQEVIFSQAVDVDKMWAHIQLRQKNPEPPLIVLTGTSLP